jgi:hypothetical protein
MSSIIDLLKLWKSAYEANLTAAGRTLLQTKHLYQSVTVDTALLPLAVRISGDADTKSQAFLRVRETLLSAGWHVGLMPAGVAGNPVMPPPVWFRVPDAKLFCDGCDRTEAFNLVEATDVNAARALPDTQTFVLSLQCQSCKRTPETFTIRRVGEKLTLCGRAPMEVVPTPSDIPKAIRRFYSWAVVAHQSGQTLAGIFLLRTLLEQWAGLIVPSAPPVADRLMEEYMATLPDDFKGRFPSVAALYGQLSDDMHAATGSPELFNSAVREIVEHFEARRLFKITRPEPRPR